VLSAHPGRVQELIEVPVPRPRNTAQCFSPEFIATKARLEELIYSAEPEDESEYPVVPRLAEAADNVE
jgi:NitT/TauT family transport system ATP-binding protein